MRIEAESYERPNRLPIFNLRWSAVLAGLVVGITGELFLLLLGAAIGLGFMSAGAAPTEERVLVAASLWNAFSMVAASIAGGYIAARASGMRRTADGILHGVLAWGVAMLTLLFLATSTVGSVIGEMLDAAASAPAAAGTARPLDTDERQAVLDVLEDRLGLPSQQAAAIADQIRVPFGRAPTEHDLRSEARQVLRAATMLSGWLSTAVLLSLAGAIGGGIAGCRSVRRAVRDTRGVRARAANEPVEPGDLQ